jgi:cation transport ATPase
MFRDRFWISLVLTIPTLIWEPMIQQWFGYAAPRFPDSPFMPPAFGAIVFFYGGWVFLEGALRELAARLPGMMTLISLAISVAFLYSVAVTLGLSGHPLWWELATLVTIMLLGHWIEMRSISQAEGALKELTVGGPPCRRSDSWRRRNGRARRRPVPAWTAGRPSAWLRDPRCWLSSSLPTRSGRNRPMRLAAGVLYWAGIVLAPAVGAVLMSASTVIVAVNAQLLRRLDLSR